METEAKRNEIKSITEEGLRVENGERFLRFATDDGHSESNEEYQKTIAMNERRRQRGERWLRRRVYLTFLLKVMCSDNIFAESKAHWFTAGRRVSRLFASSTPRRQVEKFKWSDNDFSWIAYSFNFYLLRTRLSLATHPLGRPQKVSGLRRPLTAHKRNTHLRFSFAVSTLLIYHYLWKCSANYPAPFTVGKMFYMKGKCIGPHATTELERRRLKYAKMSETERRSGSETKLNYNAKTIMIAILSSLAQGKDEDDDNGADELKQKNLC